MSAWSQFVQNKHFNIMVVQYNAPTIEFYANFQNIVDIASENEDMFLISNWNAKGVRKVASGITGAVDLDIQSRWQTNRVLGGIPASNFFQQPKNQLYMNITESNLTIKLTVYFARNYEGVLFNNFLKKHLILNVAEMINFL